MLQSAALSQPMPVTQPTRRTLTVVPATTGAKSAIACSSCCLRETCLPCGLGGADIGRFDEITAAKRKIAKGQSLYLVGNAFESLYAVRSGAFKTISVSRHGEEKVTGFHMPGELLGLDAINTGSHSYNAVALEDSEVCVIPFQRLEQLAMTMPALQHQLLRLLSSDISRDHGLMLLLGSLTAEQRVSAFLLSLSKRHQRLGFSASRFVLRMTREEMGNYLGLTIETVSRLMSRFQREGLIALKQRDIELKDPERLREIVGS